MGGRNSYYKIGDWNFLCMVCGQQRKSSQGRLRWDGVRTCEKCWEPRQSQDFVRGVPDPSGVPWSYPRTSLTFVDEATRPDGSSPAVVPIPEVTP